MSGEGDIRELVEIATVGDGLLREADEHRILKVGITTGLSPAEAKARIEAALASLGAKRAERPPEAPPKPPEPPPAKAPAPVPAPAPAGEDAPRATPGPRPRPLAKSDPVQEAISKRLGRRASSSAHRALPKEPPAAEDAPVLAEIVPVAPEAEVPVGICAACLAEVKRADVDAGRAEGTAGGLVHCRACLSKLRAGLLCLVCYGAIDRAELKDGRARPVGDRAAHASCLERAAAPPPAATTSLEGVEPLAPILGAPSPTGLAEKCAGCFVALPSSYFQNGRAVRVEGRAYCGACGRRAGRTS